ncbi:MAG: hypothetical protein AAF492_12670, partial [Verrucomicrobiota bacterium]
TVKHRIGSFPAAVMQAAVSPDHRWLASFAGKSFILSDLQTGEPVRTWPVRKSDWSISWSADGEWVAQNARLRHRTQSDPDLFFKQQQDTTCGSFHPTRLWFAYGRDDGDVELYDLRDRKRLGTYDAENTVRQLAWSPDGRYLLVASDNLRLTVLAAPDLTPVTSYQGHFDQILSVAWSPDGRRILSADHSGMVKHWRGPDEPPAAPGQRSAYRIGSEVESGPRLEGLLPHGAMSFATLRRSPDGSRIAGEASRLTGIWDAASGRLLHVLTGHTGHGFQYQPAWGPKGRWLATLGSDPFVILWDSHSGEEKHRLIGHAGFIEVCVFSPDGDRIATRSTDGTVKLWDVETGREILTIPVEGRMSLAWTEDGRTLFSPDNDRLVWDASVAYDWVGTEDFAANLEQVETLLEVADQSAAASIETAFERTRYQNYGESDLPYLKRMMAAAEADPSLIQMDYIRLAMLWCNIEAWPRILDFFLPRIEAGRPVSPHVHVALAIAFYKTGRPEEADVHMETARTFDRQFGFARGKDLRFFMDAQLAAHESEGIPVEDIGLLLWKGRVEAGAMQWEASDVSLRQSEGRQGHQRAPQSTRWRLARPGREVSPAQTPRKEDWEFTGVIPENTLELIPGAEDHDVIMRRVWSSAALGIELDIVSSHAHIVFLNGEQLLESKGPTPTPARESAPIVDTL